MKKIIIIILFLFFCELCVFVMIATFSKFGILDETFDAVRNRKRNWNIFQPERHEYAPYLLHKHKPNIEFAGWKCSTDKYGFLHNGNLHSFNLHKKEGVYRIFLVGGSAAASYFAFSNEFTIAAFLERFLNNNEEKHFEVINAAVSAYSSTQELILVSLYLNYYEPDMIITLDGYNEWMYSRMENWKPHVQPASENLIKRFNKTDSTIDLGIMAISLTIRRLGKILAPLFHYTNGLLSAINHKIGKYIDKQKLSTTGENVNSIEVYKQNLINIIAITNIRNIKYMALLQPSLGFKNNLTSYEKRFFRENKYMVNHHRSYFARLKQLFKDLKRYECESVIIEDLTQIFENNNDEIYADFCHYTKSGNELIAWEICELIKRYR